MRFTITFDGAGWSVASLDDPITTLMKAEILSLKDVAFHNGAIQADILAAWGVSLLDDSITESPQLLRALGINRSFRNPPHFTAFYKARDEFFSSESNRPLFRASRALLLRDKMYYSSRY